MRRRDQSKRVTTVAECGSRLGADSDLLPLWWARTRATARNGQNATPRPSWTMKMSSFFLQPVLYPIDDTTDAVVQKKLVKV